MPVYRGAVWLAETVTSGGGTMGEEEGQLDTVVYTYPNSPIVSKGP